MYYIHHNAAAIYKEVTLKNHGNNGLHGSFLGSILNSNFFVNSFSSVLTIMQDITTCMYIHVHVRILVLEEASTHSRTVGFAPEEYNEPQLFR